MHQRLLRSASVTGVEVSMDSETADVLMEKGFDLVSGEEYEQAIQIGLQLQERRHSSAFEILALAYAGLDDIPKAVVVLEEGIAKAPGVWRLWQLLGNYRSDLGHYTEAEEAYERAIQCPAADLSSIHLNKGICSSRQDRFEEAMAELDRVTDPDLRFRVESQRLEILRGLARYDEAISQGEAILKDAAAVEVEPQVLSAIMIELGDAYWLGRKDAEHAIALAMQALRQSPSSSGALWLIREAEGKVSPRAKYYRMIIEGSWLERDEADKEMGFFVTFDIVADSPGEALEYARRFEKGDVGASMRIEEFEELEDRTNEPKGVYRYTAHYLFPKETDDQDR
jgi:tetratricopeptide (TPR) repeat protein